MIVSGFDMNDKENTIQWKVGDLVSHDADAKRKEMLMRVVKIQKNGLYITKYAFPQELRYSGHTAKWVKQNWKNELKYLHDPQIFGMDINMIRIYGVK